MTSDSNDQALPDAVVLTRTTHVFDNDTVPAGLLKAHRVADSIWGRLVVYTGTVGFVFEEEADQPCSVDAGASVVIPPGRHHHVILEGPATFAVEFYRQPHHTAVGLESSGLVAPGEVRPDLDEGTA